MGKLSRFSLAFMRFDCTLVGMSDTVRQTNVLGTPLQLCCADPMTGFYRNGYCQTGPGDHGQHTLCAVMTEDFLDFSASRGNDLMTPIPEWHFPGLRPGDCWCLCVMRWKEALEAGLAPPVKLEATHLSALEFVELADLKKHAAV